MKIRPRTLAILISAALAGPAQLARADDAAALSTQIQTLDSTATTKSQGAVTGKIAADFQSLAGSKENATALVTGLRSGSEITLTQTGEPSATFTPPTKPMGYGNVSTSLALAKAQLAQQGITNPTPEQLKIALNGGSITVDGKTVEYQGILQMRADGMGWGQIAHQLGTKLGPVVSGIKSQNTRVATLPAAKPSAATGVTTATGQAARAGHTTAGGRGNSGNGGNGGNGKGLVTAAGTSASGHGVVSAAGSAGSASAHGAGHGQGQGIVKASGAGAGGSQGQGKALGHSK